jgi:hypothetical protein
MKPKLILCLALVLSGALTGCVMDRQFYGTGTNLTGNREQIPLGSHLKMSIASSGDTTNGGCYMVLSLPKQDCRFVLFYPNIKPKPYQFLRVEIGAKQTHVWQYEGEGTNYLMEELPDGAKQTGAWFVKGKRFNFPRLSLGASQFGLSVTNSERLRGQLEIVFENHSEFQVNVDLLGDDGTTTLQGEFWNEKSLWPPLAGPAILIFGEDWGSNSREPIQSQKARWPENKKPVVNIKIPVHGDVNNPADYLMPEGSTITTAIRVAGGFQNPSDSNNIRVIRKEYGEEETWMLNLSSGIDLSFILIQGDEVSVQAK